MKLEEVLRRFHAADRAWQDRHLRFTPLHPGFWAYRTIYRALDVVASNAKGVLLDAGCGLKPYAEIFAGRVEAHIGLEYGTETVYRGHKADLFGDITSLPVAANTVDTVLCTEVLEHVENPQAALDEFFRILKAGGLLLVTAPFVYPVHGEKDYYRYSAGGMKALLKRSGFMIERVQALTGTGRTLALLINIYIIEIGFFWTKWLYPLGVLLRPALWVVTAVINLMGALADVLLPSDHLAFNHLSIARKRQQENQGL
ncbi:MAG: class I SAM-dependent methyltransferase [bacterium]|nr:class I SAM-dependent methyltransferase [bacterium]